MTKNGKKKEPAIEATVFRAIRSHGWLLPQTEDEVRATELDEDNVELPASLLDPMEALNPLRRSHESTEELEVSDPVFVEELAQAARQGARTISADVAERMRIDRDAAEREMERSENE